MTTRTARSTMTEQLPSPDLESKHRSPSPRRLARHVKGLSLNFPILLPTQQPTSTGSPRATSPATTSPNASPTLKGAPHEASQPAIKTSTDFLTLVAAQERRVLELREELAKADAELTLLKKQWAIHEANKKRDEVRQVRREPVSLDEVPSPVQGPRESAEERKRRKALVEMTNNSYAQTQHAANALGRRGSKRVFEGRHTRTLSLLSPTSTKVASGTGRMIDQLAALDGSSNGEASTADERLGETPSLSRMPTLDGLVSPNDLENGLGKPYKDPGLHRRSLPPGTADMFMKQGKQVMEDVREGLWTFFEDIRQATVGDEAVNGTSTQHKTAKHRGGRHGRTKSKSKTTPRAVQKDNSFWREFGLDTPKKSEERGKENWNVLVRQKNSAESQNALNILETTPSEGKDDDWENWESPSSARKQAKADTNTLDTEGLHWPEIQKLTPSNLNRTASDLMREWEDGDEPVVRDGLQVQE